MVLVSLSRASETGSLWRGWTIISIFFVLVGRRFKVNAHVAGSVLAVVFKRISLVEGCRMKGSGALMLTSTSLAARSGPLGITTVPLAVTCRGGGSGLCAKGECSVEMLCHALLKNRPSIFIGGYIYTSSELA
jgi:hypothetical protein